MTHSTNVAKKVVRFYFQFVVKQNAHLVKKKLLKKGTA